MGWFYCAAIHVKTKWAAYNLVDKYAGQTFVFNDGDIGRFKAAHNEVDGEWWVNVYVKEITSSGIANEEEAKKANQFCNIMYGMLKNDAHFDYAICGVEVDEFRTLKELRDDFFDGSFANLDGLVVSTELYESIPSAYWKQLEDFSPTHKWVPKILERAKT